jgi:2-polyprenyl-3-methyl-5-hydroxy-6-metoxy-1,4-benzoquinol methylase
MMSVLEECVSAVGGNPATKVVWETTGCLLCGSDRWTPVEDAPALIDGDERCRVVRCRDCDLTYTNRRPSAETIHRFYDDYVPHRICGISPRELDHAPRRFRRKPFWKTYRPERDGLPPTGKSRLLDFGCGGGAFLQRMHRLGWQVVGLDNCSRVIEDIRAKLRLRAFVGTLPHPDLPSGSFDVVTMWHALEHVHQPLETLRQAWKVLTPNGKLVLGVPNVHGVPRRWYGAAWYGWSLPHHLTHFMPATLRAMVDRAGFRTQCLMLRGQPGWLRESAASARRQGLAAGWRQWMTNHLLSRHVSAWLAWIRQSDEIVLVAEKRLGS